MAYLLHTTDWSPVPESMQVGSPTTTTNCTVDKPLHAPCTGLPAQRVWVSVQVDMEGSACLDVAQQLCRWGLLPQLHHFLVQFQSAYAAKTGGQVHQALLSCAEDCKTALQDLEEVCMPHACLGKFGQVAF